MYAEVLLSCKANTDFTVIRCVTVLGSVNQWSTHQLWYLGQVLFSCLETALRSLGVSIMQRTFKTQGSLQAPMNR